MGMEMDAGAFIALCVPGVAPLTGVPSVYWRRAGEEGWRRDAFEITWDGENATCRAADFEMEISWQREGEWTLSRRGLIRYVGGAPVEVARIHDLEGDVGAGDVLFSMRPMTNGRCRAAQGESFPPERAHLTRMWANWKVTWPRMPDPIYDASDIATCQDFGVLSPALDRPGWAFLYTGPCASAGEVGLWTREGRFFAGMPLDGIRMDGGDERELEHLTVRYERMEPALNEWAERCAREAGVRPRLKSFAGYCSWYHDANRIMPDTVRRAADEFAPWPRPLGGLAIQIDDGFQAMPGDWGGNADWAEALRALPAYIAGRGLTPGLWLAPHAIHQKHPVAIEHPEWLQRRADDSTAVSFSNWGWVGGDRMTWQWAQEPDGQTHFLDPDRPEARDFIARLLSEKKAEGWRYFKLDFTYAVSSAREKYNPKKTCFETLRDMWRLFREALGEDAIINACVGANYRWALGSADIARIGGDMGSDPKHLAQSIREMMWNAVTNGKWWLVDPDVFYMSAAHSRGGEELNYLLAGTAFLMGGVFMTSDLPGWWTEREEALIKSLWPDGAAPSALGSVMLVGEDDLPQAFVSRREGEWLAGLYNWSDAPEAPRMELTAAGVPPRVAVKPLREGGARVADEWLCAEEQPPMSLRIFRLTLET